LAAVFSALNLVTLAPLSKIYTTGTYLFISNVWFYIQAIIITLCTNSEFKLFSFDPEYGNFGIFHGKFFNKVIFGLA